MYQDIKQVVIQIILTGWTHITDVKEPETGYSFTGSLDFLHIYMQIFQMTDV